MASIQTNSLIIDFPVYGSSGFPSIKSQLINMAIGGRLTQEHQKTPNVRALDDINLNFKDGDRIALTGHNGSGKSTLLRVLAGIYEPSSGLINIKGNISSMLSLTVGMNEDATGLENIYMRGYFMGLSYKKITSLIDEIVDFSDIGDFLYLPMRTYSSGMSMRLAFAISTSVNADIILMDEWLSVGDIAFKKKAQDRLRNIIKNAGIVIIATHDWELVVNECNLCVELEHGKITRQYEPS